ncbi:MAG: hypothetical protein IJ004_02555 [Clostridia bacterium]|nr:hypothetical protein [Clostridia bacterium]
MEKSCQKRIVYLKNPKSKYFDEAYFILKKNVCESEESLVKEAERILGKATITQCEEKQQDSVGIIPCLIGAFSGAIVTFLACLPFVI